MNMHTLIAKCHGELGNGAPRMMFPRRSSWFRLAKAREILAEQIGAASYSRKDVVHLLEYLATGGNDA